jgi:hypothetical protein
MATIGRLQNTVIDKAPSPLCKRPVMPTVLPPKSGDHRGEMTRWGQKPATRYFESTASASNQSRTMRGLALKAAGLAVALAASAIASAVPVALPSPSGDPSGAGRSFPIVAATEASAAFDNLASQGILSNQPSLRAPMTRGDFVLALQRMFNLPESKEATAFTDVPLNSPLGSALRAIGPYLGRQILCPGCALGTNFLPDQPISNLNAAFITTRVLVGQKKLQLLTPAEADAVLAKVSDAETLPPGSRVYFATGIAGGVVRFGTDKSIGPDQDQTLGDTAILLDHVQRNFAIPKANP